LTLHLFYNQIAPVPALRLCIDEVHLIEVEPQSRGTVTGWVGDWSRAALGGERGIHAPSQLRRAIG
jgi:hypothetical protein